MMRLVAIATVLLLSFAVPSARAFTQAVLSFNTPVVLPNHRGSCTDYRLDPTRERFFVYAPANYSPSQPFGLIVYISSEESFTSLPEGWAEVLQARKLLFICPQRAGNLCGSQERRTGMAVLGALEMMQHYNVDRSRVYAAGKSGGARTACDLGFTQNDIFTGTIQSCGTDFYRPVPQHEATSEIDTNGHAYGHCQTTQKEVAAARARVKFVLISGPGDYRLPNIRDIYNGGFVPDRFCARLIEVPGMGHQDCDGKTLEEALDFLR